MSLRRMLACLILPLGMVAVASAQVTFNFSTPVVLSPTEAPGVWYPDRFPPNGFVSPVTAPNGTPNTLQETIAAGDLQAGISGQNTQGRKIDVPPTSTSVSILLYVPQAWSTLNGRAAGLWLTVEPNTGGGDFPILEFQGPITTPVASGPSYQPNGGIAGFYGWNNVTGHFDSIGLPPGFTYNSFVQLTITFAPPNGGFTYTVNMPGEAGISLASPQAIPNDTGIGNVILQGYNYGTTYSIYWGGAQNFLTTASDGPYQLRYAANLQSGQDSFIDIINDGANGAPVAGPGFGTQAGTMCIGVYFIDPGEELVSCCSCQVTADQTVELSVLKNLTNNGKGTLTGVIPASATIKLVGSVGSCSSTSAATITVPVSGFVAFGTTIHQTATTGSFATAEAPFLQGSLSQSELNSLTGRCASIIGNDSTYGQCSGCTAGALGASKK
jgi:hypothetical protein